MKLFNILARLALLLAFCVIVFGAYVRLSDAGLGCPDWPGCYGQVVVPETTEQINGEYQRQLEPEKAWKEMIHRYLASTLGFLIFTLSVLAWRNRDDPNQPVFIPLFLVALVVFQGMLGMWTVTLLLKPLVVTAHLMGGMTTLALLAWLVLTTRDRKILPMLSKESPVLWPMVFVALVFLVLQIFLGGWTSSNYAAMICPDFPTCQGRWWPAMDFKEAFTLWRGTGINYEYGVLKADARTAIHMTHRIGALITFVIIGLVSFLAMRSQLGTIRKAAFIVLCLLLVQVTLGISNIATGLSLPIAVAHNGVAALLLISLVNLLYRIKSTR